MVKKREYLRIEVSVPVRFSIISAKDRERVIDEISRGLGEEVFHYEEIPNLAKIIMEKNKIQETKEANILILELLLYILKKIETIEHKIIGHVKDTYQYKAMTDDLSGGGLSFTGDFPMNINDYVDIFVEVPLFPKTGIRALGKVVRKDKVVRNYKFGISFEFIKESDREDLIKFLFIKQREILARRRLGTY